jgi:hypothetical protein
LIDFRAVGVAVGIAVKAVVEMMDIRDAGNCAIAGIGVIVRDKNCP